MQTPQPRQDRLAVFLTLFWIYASLHLNRQLPGILVEPLKLVLGLSDTQLGTLTGNAYSVVYALLGMHFGRLADDGNRAKLVIAGAWTWSLASILGAFSGSYGGLVASRVALAAGEAMATAAAVAMVSDLVGSRLRASAAAAFFAAAFLGAGIAFAVGGLLLGAFSGSVQPSGWRIVMACAGLPGILGASSLAWLNRGAQGTAQAIGAGHVPSGATPSVMLTAALAALAQVLLPARPAVLIATALGTATALHWIRRLSRESPATYGATFGNWRYVVFLVAFASTMFVDYAASFWMLPFAHRTFQIDSARLGSQLGIIMIVGGIGGALAGGFAADRLHEFLRAGRVWIALSGAIAESLSILLAIGQANYGDFLLAFCGFCFFGGTWLGAAGAIGMDLVPPDSRGTGSAGYFLFTTLIGVGLGPFCVGWASDQFGSVAAALAWCCSPALIAAGAFIALGISFERQQAPEHRSV